MRTSVFLPGTWVAAALLCVSVSTQDPVSGPQDRGDRSSPPDLAGYVGVVDALRIFNAYPKAMEAQAALQRMNDEFRAMIQQEEDRLQQLELDIMALENGTYDHRMKSLELDLGRRKLNGLVSVHQERMLSETLRINLEVYDDIWAAVARVAEAKGLKLVLRQRRSPLERSPEVQQASNERRTILFAAPELDVTDDVINMLKGSNPEGRDGDR